MYNSILICKMCHSNSVKCNNRVGIEASYLAKQCMPSNHHTKCNIMTYLLSCCLKVQNYKFILAKYCNMKDLAKKPSCVKAL